MMVTSECFSTTNYKLILFCFNKSNNMSLYPYITWSKQPKLINSPNRTNINKNNFFILPTITIDFFIFKIMEKEISPINEFD